ncbi:MAG: VanZ family protein [Candidatus Omnitrophota bacterium]|jgi:VanZ family protein
MTSLLKLIKLWVPVLLWGALIYHLSGIPNLCISTGIWGFVLRKAAHIAEFFVLTLLLYRAFGETFDLSPLYLFIYPAGLSILYAVSDEIHQFFTPSRVCSFCDVIVDSAGILFFFIIIRFKKIQLSKAA